MYSEVIYLVKRTPTRASGITSFSETKTKCYAQLNKVSSREFYNAVTAGMKVEYEFQVRTTEYGRQDEMEYFGARFDVLRTIPKGSDTVLVVGRKAIAK